MQFCFYHQFIILFAFNINLLHLKNRNLKSVLTSGLKSNVVLRIEIEIKIWSRESREQNRDHYLRRYKLVLRVEKTKPNPNKMKRFHHKRILDWRTHILLELFLILRRALNRSEYIDQVTVNLDKGTPRHRDRDKGTLSCRSI